METIKVHCRSCSAVNEIEIGAPEEMIPSYVGPDNTAYYILQEAESFTCEECGRKHPGGVPVAVFFDLWKEVDEQVDAALAQRRRVAIVQTINEMSNEQVQYLYGLLREYGWPEVS